MARIKLELVKSETIHKEVELTAEEVQLMKNRQAVNPDGDGWEEYLNLSQKLHESLTQNQVPEGLDMVDFEYDPKDFE